MSIPQRSGVSALGVDEYANVLFTIEELLEITGARLLSVDKPKGPGPRVRRLCTDSRHARPGDLFVALVGEKFDGHDFVATAIRQGAVGAILRDPEQTAPGTTAVAAYLGKARGIGRRDVWLLGVPDTLRAYQDLATHHRRRFRFPVVAVTGSNGKTTTKEMTAQVLSQRWAVMKTEGNLNNRIGVPQSILQLRSRHQVAVLELGVDHLGQTSRLCEMAQPTIGLITNIGDDHLEFFGSLDASAQAKAELIGYLPPTGALVLNADDPYFDELAARAGCPVVSFGFSERAQVRALGIAVDPRRGTEFRLALPSRARQQLVRLRVYGVHNVYNALAAAAVGHVLGLTGLTISQGLARFRPASMRSQVLVRDGVRIINDCYNANPTSMKAAIDLLVEIGASKRTIAVLGDMLELGQDTASLHREVGQLLASRGVSCLIAAGSLGKYIADGARLGGMETDQVQEAPDAQTAARVLKEMVQEGDVVLIKASRGMRMERVMEGLGGSAKPQTGRTRG